MQFSNRSLGLFIDTAGRYVDNVGTIIEIGARDCNETLMFHERFPKALIYTFECNPSTLPICRERVHGKENIILTEAAVTDKEGDVAFYSIDQENTETTWPDGNPGASSLLRTTGKYPVERYVQKEVSVKAVRLEDFMHQNSILSVDLMWMDIQGAELKALKGMGEEIKKLKALHVEVEFFDIYENQPHFKDIKRYMNSKGFIFINFTSLGLYAGDAIFIRKDLLPTSLYIPMFWRDRTVLPSLYAKKVLRKLRSVLK